MLLFILGNKKQLVPTGAQNLAEIGGGVHRGRRSCMETIGEKGLKYTPLLISLFFFIFFCNIFEIIPVFQMPATARIALPMFLALLTYVVYHGAGFQEHGPRLLQARHVAPRAARRRSTCWSRRSSSSSSSS